MIMPDARDTLDSGAVANTATHVVLLTPVGRGAVATILVAGKRAVACVAAHFQPAGRVSVPELPIGRIAFGRWGGPPGEEIVVGRRGACEFEIHCHGGEAAPRAIVDSLVAAGCQRIEWRAWIRAAEADKIAAAARIALAAAPTQQTALVLVDQMQGALRAAIDVLGGHLAAGRSEPAMAFVDSLLRFASFGLHLTRPWKVVLAGRPNVGKSSLINALVGYERAIVFDQPGTTRDVVTASTALQGWPVELSDTAGLRVAHDPLEAAGIELTQTQLATADLVVLVFDASAARTSEDEALRATWPAALVVCNKSDLLIDNSPKPDGLLTSTLSGAGLPQLVDEIVRRLVPEAPAAGQAVPFTAEQVDALRQIRRLLDAGDVAAAADCLAGPISFYQPEA